MRKLFEYGGIAASVVLIAFGIGSVVVGFNGRDRVQSDLAREKIVGTPDSAIAPRSSRAPLEGTPWKPRAARKRLLTTGASCPV